jgi:hypothetical protein
VAQGADHIVAGLFISLCCIYFFRSHIVTSVDCLILLVSCIAGSLFPDIDIKSKGQKFFYWTMAPLYLVLFSLKQIYLCVFIGIMALLPLVCRHRGLFHSLWFITIFVTLWSVALFQLFPLHTKQVAIGSLFFLVGSMSHLWLDFGIKKMIFH